MTPEQREELVRLLQKGAELSPAWSRILFPPEKRECELVYHGKEREEDILADTLAVPLQPVRTFGDNGVGWHNMLIFGDNLQAMKTLLEMKKAGRLRNADGTPGVRLVYIDPPFSTRRDFLGTEDQKAYQDKLAVEEIRKNVYPHLLRHTPLSIGRFERSSEGSARIDPEDHIPVDRLAHISPISWDNGVLYGECSSSDQS